MEEKPRQGGPEDPRVRFAGERTLLAWVRTGLALMGFGFVVARFGMFLHELAAVGHGRTRPSQGISLWIGTALVLIGVVVLLLAAMQHFQFLRRLDRGEAFQAPRWSIATVVALLLAALGVGMAAYLVFLDG
jgi:putative membrane protein